MMRGGAQEIGRPRSDRVERTLCRPSNFILYFNISIFLFSRLSGSFTRAPQKKNGHIKRVDASNGFCLRFFEWPETSGGNKGLFE